MQVWKNIPLIPLQHANMEHEQNSCTLPAKYLTAKSPLCRFRTNMPLKHANMGVSRTAALSPLNTWQPSHIYAGLEQTCHWNMPTWAICRDWIPKRNGISHNGYINCSSKTGIATPKRKNDDFEALFKSKFKSTIRNKWKKSAAEAPFATFTQPLQCKSRLSAKHKSITHAPAAARNLDTAIPLRSAQTDLHNTLELQHATVEHIALMHQSQYTKCRNTCKTQ